MLKCTEVLENLAKNFNVNFHACARFPSHFQWEHGRAGCQFTFKFFARFPKTPVTDKMGFFLPFSGEQNDSKVWRSSPIAERLSPAVLITKTGSLYHLLGALDRQEMRDYSQSLPVSDEIASKFQYGFPRNWMQLVVGNPPPP